MNVNNNGDAVYLNALDTVMGVHNSAEWRWVLSAGWPESGTLLSLPVASTAQKLMCDFLHVSKTAFHFKLIH